ncbi:hypothetical protein [Rufibacter psychrotolerans]|uniref:hypothetical protein n=1 Tax=Rufibacter psychrotolerans TaxID=2812556 RepID=UPI0019680B8A|nr:hypothetical protein [Rufibacter sp. SYSU D00308]
MKAYCIAILLFTLVSCSEKLEKEQLYGHYEFSHWSKDTLELKPDGTYYFRTYLDNRKLDNSGTWKLNAAGNEINFDKFSFLGEGLPTGNWHSRLRIDGSETYLMYASEENIYFKKLTSK